MGIPYVEYNAMGPLLLKSRMIPLASLEDWAKEPAPLGHTVQTRVKRDKVTGFFDLYLDDDHSFKFIMTAQKKAKSKSANYAISMDKGELRRAGTDRQTPSALAGGAGGGVLPSLFEY